SLAEREVQREDERIHRGEREAKRVELAQPRVVRTRREETTDHRKDRRDPEPAADRAPAKARVDQKENRPGVLDHECDPDGNPLDRLVIDERDAGESNYAKDREQRQIAAADS